MSFVNITDADDTAKKIDTIQRTDGSDTVETQAVAVIDPATGNALAPTAAGRMPVEAASLPLPTGAATQATLAALLSAAQAIQTAAEALNGKATAINTGAVGGTVALDAPTLAALETINANTGGVTDAQLRATPLPVSGTFWQTTQPVSFSWAGLTDGQLRASPVPVTGPLTDAQLRAAPFETTHSAPPFTRIGFAEVGSGLQGLAATKLSLLQTGSGQAVSQSAGNLVITTGTTTNSETVIRSADTFSGSLLARVKVILSQRIVNQTFRFELADLVGEALAYTINSSTSVTVTFGAGTNPFTAANVGQSLRLSRIAGAAGIPGRYAIASVSGDTVTFTVAGWPASGSGTLTLYGWNAIWVEYSGATATNASFDAARRGWASGATTATINTTASPGHVAQIGFDVFTVGLADALVASNTGYQWTNRASRIENIPDPDVPMYLFIVVQNGSTAPASTTTLTMGFLQVEDQGRQKVRIASSDPMAAHALPVQVMGGLLGTQPVSLATNTPTLAAGTNLAGDVGIQYRANATGAASFVSVQSPATPAAATIKATAGRVIGWQLQNSSAGLRSVKVFGVAVPTLGSTAALFEIDIPAGGRSEIQLPGGLAFGTAATYSVTSAKGLTDNTATGLGANDVSGAFFFA